MDELVFNNRLQSIQDEIIRLNNAVMAMGAYNIQKYPDNFLEFSMETAVRAEKLACKLRHLIGAYGSVKPQMIMERITEAHGIEINDENGVISIRIPRLLPKWKKNRSGEFVNQPLYCIMERYCKEHTVTKFSECAVCFVHIYDRALSLERIRDYDNLEMKHILDTVATFLMADDTGMLCDAYHTTEYGDADCTCIYIMPQDRLPDFISSRKSHPKSISNFEEN